MAPPIGQHELHPAQMSPDWMGQRFQESALQVASLN